jgi:hypothetical protein
MHGGQRTEAQAAGYLLVGRGVTILLSKAGEEIDNLFLAPRYSHAVILANKKRIASYFYLTFVVHHRPRIVDGRYSHFEIPRAKNCIEILCQDSG